MSKRIFSTFTSETSEEKILNQCPLCGNKLEFHELMQYSEVYDILKSGKLSKRMKRKEDNGPMECGFISCPSCEFHTNCDLDCEDYKGIYIHKDGEVFKIERDDAIDLE